MPSVARPTIDGSRFTNRLRSRTGFSTSGSMVAAVAIAAVGPHHHPARLPQGDGHADEHRREREGTVDHVGAPVEQQEGTDAQHAGPDPAQRCPPRPCPHDQEQPEPDVDEHTQPARERQPHERESDPERIDADAGRQLEGDSCDDPTVVVGVALAARSWYLGRRQPEVGVERFGPLDGRPALVVRPSCSRDQGTKHRSTPPSGITLIRWRTHRGKPRYRLARTGARMGDVSSTTIPGVRRVRSDADGKLPRSADRIVAGVAGAYAAKWRVEPTVVRAALGLLTLAGGIGIVLYGAGILTTTLGRSVGAACGTQTGRAPSRTGDRHRHAGDADRRQDGRSVARRRDHDPRHGRRRRRRPGVGAEPGTADEGAADGARRRGSDPRPRRCGGARGAHERALRRRPIGQRRSPSRSVASR